MNTETIQPSHPAITLPGDTQPTWILERNVFNEACFCRMVDHFKEFEVPYHIVTVVPFEHTIDGKVPEILDNNEVIAYGSIGIQKCAERYGWKPGVFSSDDFDARAYHQAYHDKYLNHGSHIYRISCVKKAIEHHFPQAEEVFIKPVGDNKEFAGQLITPSEFQEWYNGMLKSGYLKDNDFDVVINKVHNLGHEYRFVIVDGEPVTASCYKAWGVPNTKPLVPVDAYTYVRKILKYYPFRPAPVFVMDIVEVDHFDGYQIVECGTFNSAGLYACDVDNVITWINYYVMGGRRNDF